jgi:carbonic anhydrase
MLVAVYELAATEIFVVGHYGCGMTKLSCDHVLQQAVTRGVSPQTLQTLQHAGIDFQGWLRGFDSPEEGVRKSVTVIRQHPLLPADVPVHGLMICPDTGRLDLLSEGYTAAATPA